MSRVLETPAGVRLGSIESVRDGQSRNFVLQLKAGYFHGFVVRKGTDVFGYVDLCPHMNFPLTQKLDEYLTPDGSQIHCVWHGALFGIADGACISGPCVGAKLKAWPLKVLEGEIVTA